MRKGTLDSVLLHLELHFHNWKRTEQHILPVGNKKYKGSKKQILVREQENKFLKWHMDTGGQLVSTLSALQRKRLYYYVFTVYCSRTLKAQYMKYI